MSKFEEQIRSSAQRIRAKENAEMNVAPSPLNPSSRPSWGWVSTPVAAAVGLLAGMFMPYVAQTASDAPQPLERIVRVVDTVVKERTVRDTVFVPSPHSFTARASVADGSHPSAKIVSAASPDTMGRCILDDGVDYSLLASF
jgi:hypothetical protein